MLVAEGIHRLTQGVVNFYLVEDGGKLTLIDSVLLTRAQTDLTGRIAEAVRRAKIAGRS